MLSWKTEEGPFQAECLESHVEGFGAYTEGGKEPLKNCKQNGAWSVDITRVVSFFKNYSLCSPIIFYSLLELTFNIIFIRFRYTVKWLGILKGHFVKNGLWRRSENREAVVGCE